MGLLNKLFSDTSNSGFKLAQDLVAIAMADGEISEEERKVIKEICQSEGIDDSIVEGCLQGRNCDTSSMIPLMHKDKTNYLRKLIQVMGIDGDCSHMEIYLLEIIASKMGISYIELMSLVLTTATPRYFEGNTGGKVLASFMKHVITPKGKSMQENMDGIKKLYDLIAENIPQHQDEEEHKAAIVKAMHEATNMMTGNSLLAHEFQAVGIDFETILHDECEQAIRRWLSK